MYRLVAVHTRDNVTAYAVLGADGVSDIFTEAGLILLCGYGLEIAGVNYINGQLSYTTEHFLMADPEEYVDEDDYEDDDYDYDYEEDDYDYDEDDYAEDGYVDEDDYEDEEDYDEDDYDYSDDEDSDYDEDGYIDEDDYEDGEDPSDYGYADVEEEKEEKISDIQLLENIIGADALSVYTNFYFWRTNDLYENSVPDEIELKPGGKSDYWKRKSAALSSIKAQGTWVPIGMIDRKSVCDSCTLGHGLRYVYLAWNKDGVDVDGNKYPDFKELAFGGMFSNVNSVVSKLDVNSEGATIGKCYKVSDSYRLSQETLLNHPNVIKFGSTCVTDFFSLSTEQMKAIGAMQRMCDDDIKELLILYSKTPDEIQEINDSFKVLDEFIGNIGIRDVMRGIAGMEPLASIPLVKFYTEIRNMGLIPPESLIRALRVSFTKDLDYVKFTGGMHCPSTLENVFYIAEVPQTDISAANYNQVLGAANDYYFNNGERANKYKGIKTRGPHFSYSSASVAFLIKCYYVDYTVRKLSGYYEFDGVTHKRDGGFGRLALDNVAHLNAIERKQGIFSDLEFNLEYLGKVAKLETLLSGYVGRISRPKVPVCGVSYSGASKYIVEMGEVTNSYGNGIEVYAGSTLLNPIVGDGSSILELPKLYNDVYRRTLKYNKVMSSMYGEPSLDLDGIDSIINFLEDVALKEERMSWICSEENPDYCALLEKANAEVATKQEEHERLLEEEEAKRLKVLKERKEKEEAERLAAEEAEKAKVSKQKSDIERIIEIHDEHGIFEDNIALVKYLDEYDKSKYVGDKKPIDVLNTCAKYLRVSDRQLFWLKKLYKELTGKEVKYGVVQGDKVSTVKAKVDKEDISKEDIQKLLEVYNNKESYTIDSNDVERTLSVILSVVKSGTATPRQKAHVDKVLEAYNK